jgi:dolichyl-phosphate beta-glucosyltransferase
MFNSQTATSARVCVVVPCYEEAARLDIRAFRDYFAAHSGVRFLFVDDGSGDHTAAVLKDLCEGHEDHAAYLQLSPNGGKAEAVRKGILHAMRQYDLDAVGFWDADLAAPLDALLGFIGVLARKPSVDMVLGSRVQLLGRRIRRKVTRHYLGRVFATLASLTLRLPVYDTQCGAKLFRVTPALKQVFAEPFLSKWVFDVEILARFLQLDQLDSRYLESAIYEFALEQWSDVAGSKVKPGDFFTAMLDLVRIRRAYLSKR